MRSYEKESYFVSLLRLLLALPLPPLWPLNLILIRLRLIASKKNIKHSEELSELMKRQTYVSFGM